MAPVIGTREATILEHHGLVRAIVLRMAQRFPSHIEVDELISVGMLGLIDAFDRFEPSRGVPFHSYAEIRVRGAIIDALREADWIPRSVRRNFARLESTRAELQRRSGRPPEREEMARALGVELGVYEDLFSAAQIRTMASLDLPTGEDGGGLLVDQLADGEECVVERWVREEQLAGLAAAIASLPERERAVVTSYYQGGMSLKEIGASLGVTESRACQLRGKAVNRLQECLQELLLP